MLDNKLVFSLTIHEEAAAGSKLKALIDKETRRVGIIFQLMT